MDAQQNANLQMCAALKTTCDAHTSAWTDFAPFATPYADFVAKLALVDNILAQQALTSTGTTAAKKALRLTLEGQIVQIAASVELYGRLTGNLQMAKDAHTMPSDVNKMAEKAFIGHAVKIHALAAGFGAAAKTTVNLTTAQITAAQDNITAFTDMVGTPRHKVIEAEDATKQLAIIIDEIMTIVTEQLDPAARVLQYSQQDFISEYFLAREIIDPGYNTRALTVNITNGQSGERLSGIEALITPGNIEKKSGAAGSFYINNLAAGTYNMVLNGNSFQSKTQEFTIMANEPTVVEVSLLPSA